MLVLGAEDSVILSFVHCPTVGCRHLGRRKVSGAGVSVSMLLVSAGVVNDSASWVVLLMKSFVEVGVLE